MCILVRLAFPLQMVSWRFIQVVLCISSSFLLVAEQYSVVWVHHILFNHLPVRGHLGSFQFRMIINKAAMNISLQVSA